MGGEGGQVDRQSQAQHCPGREGGEGAGEDYHGCVERGDQVIEEPVDTANVADILGEEIVKDVVEDNEGQGGERDSDGSLVIISQARSMAHTRLAQGFFFCTVPFPTVWQSIQQLSGSSQHLLQSSETIKLFKKQLFNCYLANKFP